MNNTWNIKSVVKVTITERDSARYLVLELHRPFFVIPFWYQICFVMTLYQTKIKD